MRDRRLRRSRRRTAMRAFPGARRTAVTAAAVAPGRRTSARRSARRRARRSRAPHHRQQLLNASANARIAYLPDALQSERVDRRLDESAGFRRAWRGGGDFGARPAIRAREVVVRVRIEDDMRDTTIAPLRLEKTLQ